jgi:hypothetical protein
LIENIETKSNKNAVSQKLRKNISQSFRKNLLKCLIIFLFRTNMICVVSGATTMHAHLTVTSASVKQILTMDRFKDYSTGRNTAVRRRPGLNRVTWKTPSSRAFIPLQEPVAVLASYMPHTQMPV